jgi:ribosomal protein S6-L-glutamate ligase RimK-like protein
VSVAPVDPQPIHILYENPAWLPPLVGALETEGVPYALHEAWHGLVDARREPEPGIWLNRMSPSAHTRGHGTGVALMREILGWLEAAGRRVVNGARAFEIEVSKLRQDIVLRRHGIDTPRTVLAVGRERILEASLAFDGPFLTKHNQGGKGLGIRLCASRRELEAYLESPDFDAGPNEQVVLQEYIAAPEPFITRVELVGGRFVLAMRSATTSGFELCPADSCELERRERQPDVCPADGSASFSPSPLRADDPLVARYRALCAAEGIDIAGIELIEDAAGRRYTYDINANTNYNAAFGRQIGVDGMREVARWLARGAPQATSPAPAGG